MSDMMAGVKSVWLALSDAAAQVCCEDNHNDNGHSHTMPIDLLNRIGEEISRRCWLCSVIVNHCALPTAYSDLCSRIAAEVIVPGNYEGGHVGAAMAVVMDQDSIMPLNHRLLPARVLLRVRQASLGNLAAQVLTLLGRVSDVSLRHPDLLRYTDEDLHIYQDQLEEVGRWTIAQGPQWTSFRLDCLTDGILASNTGECGAGLDHLTIGPDGQAYLCPAFLHSGKSLGAFLGEIDIAGRHLLTRSYSLMCKACSVDYCLRCVYHNKVSTREYCVSAASVCKLAHVEQRARAALAEQIKHRGLWHPGWTEPTSPEVLDPFESIGAEQDVLRPLWQQPSRPLPHADEVSPAYMLDIIHEVQGIVCAAHRCVQEGVDVSPEILLADTPLGRARSRTIEAYRDARFGPGCPSVCEIERAVLSGKRQGDVRSER